MKSYINISITAKSFLFELINYFILCTCIYLSILIYLKNIDIEGFNYFGPQIRRIADAMLFSLPILFSKKKIIILPYLFLVNLYLLSIVWYYRNYGTPMPLTSYLLVNNIPGLSRSVFASMLPLDFFQIVPSLFYCTIYCCFLHKKRILNYCLNSCIGIASILLISCIALKTYYHQDKSELNTTIGSFKYMPARGLKQMGILQFWITQINSFKGFIPQTSIAEVNTFMNLHNNHKKTIDDSIPHSSKNLILILVESLCSWPINLNIDGTYVTPCINRLIKEEDCLYFPNVLPQVKDGRSSDAQLLINTGLLPINSGATSSLYPTNNFPSLPKALKEKGYTSFIAICDDKRFWNQEAINTSFGIDSIYDKLCHPTERILCDSILFEKSLPKLNTTKQPFYAQLVTISMHQPYTKSVLTNEFKQSQFKTDDALYYCIATHYTDYLIGKFIQHLKQEGLFSNSIIVITGDHDACGFNKYEGRSICEIEDRYIPFIILNSKKSANNTNKTIGQVDIYPSLLSLMNINDYQWQGLGENIFSDTISDCAIYHTGEKAGSNTTDTVINYRKKIWQISDLIIRSDYFQRK